MAASLPTSGVAVRQLLAGLQRVRLSTAAKMHGLRADRCPHAKCGGRIGIWGDFNWGCWDCGAGSTPAAFVAAGLFGLTAEQSHRVLCDGCEACGFGRRGRG